MTCAGGRGASRGNEGAENEHPQITPLKNETERLFACEEVNDIGTSGRRPVMHSRECATALIDVQLLSYYTCRLHLTLVANVYTDMSNNPKDK